MKHYFFLVWSLAGSVIGHTQDTSFLKVQEVQAPFEVQQKIRRYDAVFGYQQPASWWLKWNVLSALPAFSEDPVTADIIDCAASRFETLPRTGLSGEWKLSPAFSLDAGAEIGLSGSRYFKGKRFGWGMQVAPRWYFNMGRQVRKGIRASNFSGNYLSVEYRHFQGTDRPPQSEAHETLVSSYQAVTFRFGMQRRLLRFGFVDLSMGFGHNRRIDDAPKGVKGAAVTAWFAEPRLAAGFSIGRPSHKKTTPDWCAVLQCYEETNRLWKLDITQLIQSSGDNLRLKPTLAVEQKIARSAFSVEAEIQGVLNVSDCNDVVGLSINVQPRWYFLQRRQLAKGKAGNNLSGLFGGMTLGANWLWLNQAVYDTGDNRSWYAAPHLGAQFRMFDRGYIQYKFGIFISQSPNETFYLEPSGFYSELRAGWAF